LHQEFKNTMSLIEELQKLRKHEDHTEFKKAEHNYLFAGGLKADPRDRRHCILGYVVVLANEKGGCLVLCMADAYPHEFTNCIKEGKPLPDNSYSDDYQVDLRFYDEIPDDAFHLFAKDFCHPPELESPCRTPLIASHSNARAIRYSWINCNT